MHIVGISTIAIVLIYSDIFRRFCSADTRSLKAWPLVRDTIRLLMTCIGPRTLLPIS